MRPSYGKPARCQRPASRGRIVVAWPIAHQRGADLLFAHAATCELCGGMLRCPKIVCPPTYLGCTAMFAIQEPTRREWLRIGGLSWASLAISHLTSHLPRARSLAHSAPSSGGAGRARNCIVLFMAGGPPHHDTWDPKPLAPVEIRGDIEPMSHRRTRRAGQRTDATHRPVDGPHPRSACPLNRRQRPLRQRLLHAHRPPAPADELRELPAGPAQRSPQPRRNSSAAVGPARPTARSRDAARTDRQ
jgi:hypothetical protein